MSFISGRFDNDEIVKMLIGVKYPSGFKLKGEGAWKVVNLFWRMDAYNSLISKKPYVDYLISYISKNLSIPSSRFEFLDYVFETNLKKNLLDKLIQVASDMEVAQVNDAKKESFTKLLREDGILEKEEALLFQKHIFSDRKKSEEYPEVLTGFIHHIVQEYLAAKMFIKMGVIEHLDFFVVIKKNHIEAINPSWYGVIRFLLESDKRDIVLDWLLNFAERHGGTVNESFANTVTSIDPKSVTDQTKKRIFELVFSTFQHQVVWLPTWSRYVISGFALSEHIKDFKRNINIGKTESERIVRTSNIVTIVGALLKSNSELVKGESEFWKEKLVQLTNLEDENGVIKRHSLSALEAYKDPMLIPIVESCYKHNDSLVKEAFVEFCYETDPNAPKTIEYLVKGVKDGVNFYPRRGLYKVSTKKAIILLLDSFANDKEFIDEFLDKESIYNSKGRFSDLELIKNFKKFVDDSLVLERLKKVVLAAFNERRYFKNEKSYFLKKLVKLVYKKSPEFVDEVLNKIGESSEKERWRIFYNHKSLFAWVLTPKSLELFSQKISNILPNESQVALESVLNALKWDNTVVGEELERQAIANNYIRDRSKDPKPDWELEARSEYQDFKELLSPEEGKYSTQVFEYFNQHKRELSDSLTKKDLAKLKKITGYVLDGADPKKIKLSMNDRKGGDRSYKITTWVSYYIDAIKTSIVLGNKINGKLRQNVINFIPFAYSDDRSFIDDVINKVTDEELEYVNSVYLDKKDDRRYFLPDSYVWLCEQFVKKGSDLKNIRVVLESFVTDSEIEYYARKNSLELIDKFLDEGDIRDKIYLENLFKTNYKSRLIDDRRLAEVVNRILVTKYHDETAVDWRISEIKSRREEMEIFVEEKGAHSVGEIENELHDKYMAGPLIKLGDISFLDKLIELLDYSVTTLKNKNLKTKNFVNYIWEIFYGYIENLEPKDRVEAIEISNKWKNNHLDVEGINWFGWRLDVIRNNFLAEIGKTGLKRMLIEETKNAR